MFESMVEWIKNMVRGSCTKCINKKKLLEFMEKTWDDVQCPVCKHSDWHVSAKVFCLKELDRDSWEQSGVVPVIPVTCGNCGNTILINAFTAGLLES